MDAPVYPPAEVYIAPRFLPRGMSVRDTPIAELQANPVAWAIVVKEIPGMGLRLGNDALKPHLGNFSLESLLPFGVLQKDALARIDVQLRALGDAK